MKTATRIFAWFERWILAVSRNGLWVELRTMDQDSLRKAGITPELLNKGPHAWPWQFQSDGCLSCKALTEEHEPQGSLESPHGVDRDGPIVAPV
jgi:hypothetical protein